MNIFSLWGFVWIASVQALAQKNVMFCLHVLVVHKKTDNSVKNWQTYDVFRRSPKDKVNAYISKFCSASGVNIYSVNLDHETTFLTLAGSDVLPPSGKCRYSLSLPCRNQGTVSAFD